MGREKYKYKEKTNNHPKVTDTLFPIRLYWPQLTTESEKYKCTEKSSNIPQVTDTLFHKVYRVHLTMGSEKYKYKEKTNHLPQVTETICFIRFIEYTLSWEVKNISAQRNPVTFRRLLTYFFPWSCIEYTWPWEVKNISAQRNPVTFRRSLIHFFLRLHRVHLTMGSEKYKYKEKTSNIPQVTDTLYFISLRRVQRTMGSEKYKYKGKTSSIP
jgi:hypothetical protein